MKKILIVENNPVYLKLLVHFFEQEDCTTTTANDGLSALNTLESFTPDIIVTDIIMPKIGGDQLCHIVRSSNKLKDVFLVVLSSVLTEDNIVLDDLNADLYLAKGSKVTLHNCILDILSKYEKGIRRQTEIIRKEKASTLVITKELLTAKRHYETFFYNLADAIIELNVEAQIIQANRAASSLFNRKVHSLLSKNFISFLSGPEVKEIREWFNKLNNQGATSFLSSYDTPLSIQGRQILLHLMSIGEGEEPYIIGICQDITKRKQTERQLQESHEYLRAKNKEIAAINDLLTSTLAEYELIFDNGHLGIMIFSDGQYLSRCNRRLSNILGYSSPTEMIGLSMDDIHLDLLSSRDFTQLYREKIQQSSMERVEYQLRRGDGNKVWCLLSGKALDNSSPIDLTKGIVWIVEDISERKEFEQTIRHQAHFDSLTGLPNRRQLLKSLGREISRATRHNQNGALFFIDLDNFKTINDALGHSTGDKLLKLVANRITKNLRKEDITARMGGDEFVIILPNLHEKVKIAEKKAQEIATKLCNLLSHAIHLEDQELHITLSIGIALFPTPGKGVGDLLKQADTAMYRAKSAGRNTTCFFLPSMQEAADRRLRINTELKRAIANDELTVYYQPQLNYNGRIVGAEALIRWNHPTKGFVSPGEFIPVAEETGIISDIGHWVLNKSCLAIKRWSDSELLTETLTIAVNFSPKEFSMPDFVDKVISTLDKTQVAPTQLNIELTEGSLVASVKDTINKIMALREQGIRFSIDDFGTGYSSLAYLQKLPLNTVKIDRSFVSGLSENTHNTIIVDTIIMMAKNLGLDVIAEGVEKKEEINYLQSRGCMVYQGFYFHKPLPEEAFTELLVQNKG